MCYSESLLYLQTSLHHFGSVICAKSKSDVIAVLHPFKHTLSLVLKLLMIFFFSSVKGKILIRIPKTGYGCGSYLFFS